MLYKTIKILSFIVCILPRTLRRVTGNGLGQLCWLMIPKKRKTMAIHNVTQGLNVSVSQAETIVRLSTVRFGRMFLEVLAFPRIKKEINQQIYFDGKDYLTEALAHGRGAVVATSHSGNWELLGAALALNGFPMIAVAQKQTNAEMDRFINDYRTLVGMHVTYKTGVREMVKMLSAGKVIGMLMDQDAGRDGVFVDFFQRQASAPKGPAFLARMKNAPIVPTFITENTDGTHTVLIQKPIWVGQTEDKEHDILVATQQLTKIIEQHIISHPQEWFWLHNRWKSRPQEN